MKHTPSQYEVETFSGRWVNVAAPQPETITLEDVAHALANTCRFGGHCQRYYSVAEHSVFVSRRLERQLPSGALTAMAALHHDDAEAFLGDIPRPMKPLLGAVYSKLTDRMDEAITKALGLPFTPCAFHRQVVKDADNFALVVEARHLLPSEGRAWDHEAFQGELPSRIITPDYWMGGLEPDEAEQLYLDRHKELMNAA